MDIGRLGFCHRRHKTSLQSRPLLPTIVGMRLVQFILLFCFFSAPLWAAPTAQLGKNFQGLIEADDLLWDHEKERVELQGNVQIVKGEQHIKSDRAIIHMRSKQLE